MTPYELHVLGRLAREHQVAEPGEAFYAACARLAREGLVWFRRVDDNGPLAQRFGGCTLAYPVAHRRIAELLG
jgi:hypothetical protein